MQPTPALDHRGFIFVTLIHLFYICNTHTHTHTHTRARARSRARARTHERTHERTHARRAQSKRKCDSQESCKDTSFECFRGSPFIYAVSELQYNLCLVLSPTLCHCPISLFGTGSRRHLVGQGHVKVKILSQKMISLQTKSRI